MGVLIIKIDQSERTPDFRRRLTNVFSIFNQLKLFSSVNDWNGVKICRTSLRQTYAKFEGLVVEFRKEGTFK